MAMPGALPDRARAAANRLRARICSQRGYTLIEMLVGMTLTLFIAAATLTLLEAATRAQSRDQSYAQEITSTQTALARMVHDLRQATAFGLVSPNAIQFQMVAGGATINVKYDCTASDSLGAAYRRCARTQAVAPGTPPAAGTALGALDIQHVANGTLATFCNPLGSAPSGSVFFVSNPTIANTDGSALACDEAYENLIGPQLKVPTYVAVQVNVPASGDQVRGGLSHQTVLRNGAFLPNSDTGA
jgi:prepilin-type N-terminal cleavage/methylation domain-containing protein